MTRKLASVQRIAELAPIDGADAIEAVRINGWWVVAKKGEFKENDLVVYFEIDSWVPHIIAPFLSKGKEPRLYNDVEGERLRTVTLRGQRSQGLVLPISVTDGKIDSPFEGQDLTEVLGVQKWEPVIPAEIAGEVEGLFPSWIPRTDEERVQNIPEEVAESYDIADEYEITMKVDGTSFTAYHKDGKVGVCSRNYELKINDANQSNSLVRMLIDSNLREALPKFHNIAVQGELMGPGIQGNREKFPRMQLFIYKIYFIDEQRFATTDERMMLLALLHNLGVDRSMVQHVPVIESRVRLPYRSVSDLLTFADGPSITHPVREGLVFKRVDGSFSFKAVSNKFLDDKKNH